MAKLLESLNNNRSVIHETLPHFMLIYILFIISETYFNN